jgi:uncharacterized membrane protein YhaH (DUF805 family)
MEWMLMPLKRYAEFTGRSRPMELWMFALLQLVIYVMLFGITFVIGIGFAGYAATGPSATPAGLMGMIMAMGVFALVYVVVYLGLFIPNLAVSTRRLHDTGRSGWWVMLYFGPWLLGLAVGFANVGAQSQGLIAIGYLLSGLQFIGVVVLIVFWCLPGNPGPNEYGPSPMGGAANLAETFQ